VITRSTNLIGEIMSRVKFIHDGDSIDFTPAPGGNVAAGDVVVQGDLVGVAKMDIAADTLGALAVTGVFDFPKATGTGSAIAAGVNVYWHSSVTQANTTASGGKLIGKTVRAAVDADTTVRARLSQ
jgi:predicted RecA/RadA family phage recombinase